MRLRRTPENKWKREFTFELRWRLRNPFLFPQWELADEASFQQSLREPVDLPQHVKTPRRPDMSWADFGRRDSGTSAVAKIKIKGQTYWVRAMRITDGEAQLAGMLAFGLLGADYGTHTSLTLYRQDGHPGDVQSYGPTSHIIDNHKDVKRMLAKV